MIFYELCNFFINDMTFEFFKRCKIVLFNSVFMNHTVINHYGVFTLMSSHAEMTSFSMFVIQNIRILPVNDIGHNSSTFFNSETKIYLNSIG